VIYAQEGGQLPGDRLRAKWPGRLPDFDPGMTGSYEEHLKSYDENQRRYLERSMKTHRDVLADPNEGPGLLGAPFHERFAAALDILGTLGEARLAKSTRNRKNQKFAMRRQSPKQTIPIDNIAQKFLARSRFDPKLLPRMLMSYIKPSGLSLNFKEALEIMKDYPYQSVLQYNYSKRGASKSFGEWLEGELQSPIASSRDDLIDRFNKGLISIAVPEKRDGYSSAEDFIKDIDDWIAAMAGREKNIDSSQLKKLFFTIDSYARLNGGDAEYLTRNLGASSSNPGTGRNPGGLYDDTTWDRAKISEFIEANYTKSNSSDKSSGYDSKYSMTGSDIIQDQPLPSQKARASKIEQDLLKPYVPVGQPWTVLGVDPSADGEEILKSYRRLSKYYHPDSGNEEDFSTFKRIQEAFEWFKSKNYFNTGGMVYASTGKLIDFQPKGTDTVPAMLTPGEFVVNAKSTAQHLPLLKQINSGAMSSGGVVYAADGARIDKASKIISDEPKALNSYLRLQGKRLGIAATVESVVDYLYKNNKIELERAAKKYPDIQKEIEGISKESSVSPFGMSKGGVVYLAKGGDAFIDGYKQKQIERTTSGNFAPPGIWAEAVFLGGEDLRAVRLSKGGLQGLTPVTDWQNSNNVQAKNVFDAKNKLGIKAGDKTRVIPATLINKAIVLQAQETIKDIKKADDVTILTQEVEAQKKQFAGSIADFHKNDPAAAQAKADELYNAMLANKQFNGNPNAPLARMKIRYDYLKETGTNVIEAIARMNRAGPLKGPQKDAKDWLNVQRDNILEEFLFIKDIIKRLNIKDPTVARLPIFSAPSLRGFDSPIPKEFNKGGIVYANNGALISAKQRGSDTVPAMLTPGEFVVNRQAAQHHMPVLQAINSGHMNHGGIVKYLAQGGAVAPKYYAAAGMVSQGGGGASSGSGGGIDVSALAQEVKNLQSSFGSLASLGETFKAAANTMMNSASKYNEAAANMPDQLAATVTNNTQVNHTGLDRLTGNIEQNIYSNTDKQSKQNSHNSIAQVDRKLEGGLGLMS
jgi:curved DNA-binding protein CbpA